MNAFNVRRLANMPITAPLPMLMQLSEIRPAAFTKRCRSKSRPSILGIGKREEFRRPPLSTLQVVAIRYMPLSMQSELDCSAVVSPYGDGTAARRIADVLKSQDPGDLSLTKKEFHNLPVDAL